jgi:hypothetical protein
MRRGTAILPLNLSLNFGKFQDDASFCFSDASWNGPDFEFFGGSELKSLRSWPFGELMAFGYFTQMELCGILFNLCLKLHASNQND